MKLLVFEYSSVIYQDNLISEGFGMLKGILGDLDSLDYNVTYLLSSNLSVSGVSNCECINISGDLFGWLRGNCGRFDACLFIAPEDNLIQYRITRILEENNVVVIGSNSTASYNCSSKYLTYKLLDESILKIRTIKCSTNNIDYDYIKDFLDNYDSIIKPDDRTSSDLIYHIHNMSQLDDILETYKEECVESFLLQEYIPGRSVSISLLCNDNYANILSLNSQEVSYDNNRVIYTGCKSPITHPLEETIKSISRHVVKSIPGLKGFIGIDYIISDNKVYVVEINSRITTPYIVLRSISDVNLTEALIELVLHDKHTSIMLTGNDIFNK
ncbi:MAG: ATP-grasp domain-containing protein [Methanosphaera sp.]|nr:ATP-grasp domain-containing protein [Methanosphaera sp.]